MPHTRKTALRTCIACGETDDKRSLVRIVRTPQGDVVIDPSGKANGRGAYLSFNMDCFETAVRRKRLDPALRVRLQEDDLNRLRREFEQLITASQVSRQGE